MDVKKTDDEQAAKWPPEVAKKWDRFTEKVDDRIISEDHEFWDKVYRITKITFSVALFLFVFCAGVVSKGAILILTWNIFTPSNVTASGLKTLDRHFIFNRKGASLPLSDGETETNIHYIWALFLVVIAPNVTTILYFIWRLLLKKSRDPTLDIKSKLKSYSFIMAILSGTLHSIGLSIFMFSLLPSLDPIAGLWYCCSITLAPAAVEVVVSFIRKGVFASSRQTLRFVGRVLVFLFSVVSIVCWGLYVAEVSTSSVSGTRLMLFILSPILVSLGWWENFLPDENMNTQGDTKCQQFYKWLFKLKYQTHISRHKIYAISNTCKVIVTLLFVIVVYAWDSDEWLECAKALFGKRDNPVMLNSDVFGKTWLHTKDEWELTTPYLVAVTGILTSFICHRFGVAAIRIVVQIVSFSLPAALITPVAFAVVLLVSIKLNDDYEIWRLPFPQLKGDGSIKGLALLIVASLTGYLSLLLLTRHVWTNQTERMEREDKLFYEPLYNGSFLDQSLLMNRWKKCERKVDLRKVSPGMDGSEETQEKVVHFGDDLKPWKEADSVPFLYLCATMWHETETEMAQLVKSIFRMDIDQCAKSYAYEKKSNCKDFYNFEVHILFDDAFEAGEEGMTNSYVETFRNVIKREVSSSYLKNIGLRQEKKLLTPYGGRLVWKLPGGNKLIVHLKDKHKIRVKKRWSQVMYMYYFLSYNLLVQEDDFEKQKEKAHNTFILALDGDVDFRPSAVKLLVDRMKGNPEVGAACGRIHPIGSGPMVWYQKFEYAVSHWLVKATEHVTGCVLCSPGCFSLFRGSALMDCNVMKRYTTVPTEAVHHLQYDQGEDRWLCTLLLKKGYKIDYCAASDASTFAPEGFKEFYKQRRRWTPSTMANVLDILGDWKNIRKRNNYMSLPYIALQIFWFASSVLAPALLFMIIVGAINLAYPDISLYVTLLINLAPLILFIVACFYFETETQLNIAAVLSIMYSLVMMIVLVGLIRNAAEDGFCSISTPFFLSVCGIFVIAGLTHPKEFGCLFHGLLFFIAIPSMSILLMIYSIINLNEVSWGTRESPNIQSQGSKQKDGMDKNFLNRIFNRISCNCTCGQTTHTRSEEVVNRLDDVISKLDQLESGKQRDNQPILSKAVPVTQSPVKDTEASQGDVGRIRFNPVSTPKKLSTEEEQFWEWLIDTYLSSLTVKKGGTDTDEQRRADEKRRAEEKQKTQDLQKLRNKASLAFLLINALVVTLLFFLQQTNLNTGGKLSINVTCEGGGTLQIEPISIGFTLMFGILLLIQFVCMILHRWKTFQQINSITSLLSEPDAKQIFLDVANQIVENKRDKEVTETDKAKSFSRPKHFRLKKFIERNMKKQQEYATKLASATKAQSQKEFLKTVKALGTQTIGKQASTRTEMMTSVTSQALEAHTCKTLERSFVNLSKSNREKLVNNESFKQMFLLPNQSESRDSFKDRFKPGTVVRKPKEVSKDDVSRTDQTPGPSQEEN